MVFKNLRVSYLKVNSLISADDSRGGGSGGGGGGGSSGSGGDEIKKYALHLIITAYLTDWW